MQRILYVEDNADTREVVKLLFRESYYDVVMVEDVRAAIMAAKSAAFDLYLVDYWLGQGGDGIDFCWEIRKFDSTTPILFYSADYQSDKDAPSGAGAQAYLSKPAGIKDLLREVQRLLSS